MAEIIDGEMIAMGIIASAGDARSFAFAALEEAKREYERKQNERRFY